MTTSHQEDVRFETYAQELYHFIEGYADLFKSRPHTYVEKAKQYVSGLFQAEKSNIEAMSETVEGNDLQNLNHFISQSPWDATAVIARIGQDTEHILQQVAQQTGQKIGYLVDKSGWRKQGKQSVGVSRQYLGSLGKIDHGQVAVFGSLSCGNERGHFISFHRKTL